MSIGGYLLRVALLQILAGTLAQTSGEVSIKGRIAALLELGSGFDPEFSGRENVFLNGRILGLTQKEIEARYDQIVEFADIGEFIDQPVKNLLQRHVCAPGLCRAGPYRCLYRHH